MKRTTSPGAFQVVVGSRPYGTDPSWTGHTPPTPRNTYLGAVVTTGVAAHNANIVATTPPVGMSGTVTVADNDFTTGWVEFILGDYRLISDIEFAVGAGVNDTATNLAAAISLLPGFSASAVGADVTVLSSDTMGEIDFRALHRGTKVNLTFVPSTGFLSGGDPTIGAPVMT